jgi:Cu/Ag efflux protein CusF
VDGVRLWPRLALATISVATAIGFAGGQEATSGVFAGHGVVKAVQAATGVLTIQHDDIKGFMPAMEMMYKVKSTDLSKNLHPGDVIDFKIDASKYTIVEVKRVTPAK